VTSPARSHTARRIELSAAALACAAALAFAGCGGSDDPPAPAAQAQPPAQQREGGVVDISGTQPVGEMTAGSVASLVECRDWNGADEEQKLATIADVRAQLNPEDTGIEAPELTDEEAMKLFDSSCKPAYAAGFRLYKLYAQAAGFIGLERMLEQRQP